MTDYFTIDEDDVVVPNIDAVTMTAEASAAPVVVRKAPCGCWHVFEVMPGVGVTDYEVGPLPFADVVKLARELVAARLEREARAREAVRSWLGL